MQNSNLKPVFMKQISIYDLALAIFTCCKNKSPKPIITADSLHTFIAENDKELNDDLASLQDVYKQQIEMA